jgi:hypothetical protein
MKRCRGASSREPVDRRIDDVLAHRRRGLCLNAEWREGECAARYDAIEF